MCWLGCCWLEQGIPAWCTERGLASQFCPTEGSTMALILWAHMSPPLGNLLYLVSFYWRAIALQCCVCFAVHSYMCTYAPSLWSLPPTHPHARPLGHHRAPGSAPRTRRQLPSRRLTHGSVCMSVVLSHLSFTDFHFLTCEVSWSESYCIVLRRLNKVKQFNTAVKMISEMRAHHLKIWLPIPI